MQQQPQYQQQQQYEQQQQQQYGMQGGVAGVPGVVYQQQPVAAVGMTGGPLMQQQFMPPQQQQQQQLFPPQQQQQQQQMAVLGGQMQLFPAPGAPTARPMVSRRQQQQQQLQPGLAPHQQQQQQYQAAVPQLLQPLPAAGGVGFAAAAAPVGGAVLPMQAWQMLPAHICESLVQIMAARPNLGPAVTDLQGLAQLSGLSGAGQARVVQQLWSMPVPPLPSMAVGLLQLVCSTAGL